MIQNLSDNSDIWRQIELKTRQFEELDSWADPGCEKSSIYSIIAQSAAIGGSTLTEHETELLFERGLAAKGKSPAHHLMNTDLKNAYAFAAELSREELVFSPDLLKSLNAIVMKSAGDSSNVTCVDFDSSKGGFRHCDVSTGGRSYVNCQKVPELVGALCDKLNRQLNADITDAGLRELHEQTFSAHLEIATIHPWADGNGRMARLLMNLLQFRLKLIPTKTFSEDKTGYINAMHESQDTGDASSFLTFMACQHLKTLETELVNALTAHWI